MMTGNLLLIRTFLAVVLLWQGLLPALWQLTTPGADPHAHHRGHQQNPPKPLDANKPHCGMCLILSAAQNLGSDGSDIATSVFHAVSSNTTRYHLHAYVHHAKHHAFHQHARAPPIV